MSVVCASCQVHFFGKMSVHDTALIGEVDEHVVADFFNTVSNVRLTGNQDDGTAQAEPRFPFGGYWQAMREGTTARDVRQLRALVFTSLGEDSGHVKNADTFKAWYVLKESRQSELFTQLVEVLGGIAARCFAQLYADGGCLHSAEREQDVTPTAWARVYLPRSVIDGYLRTLFSKATSKWLTEAYDYELHEHMRRGFRSEKVEGETQLFAGGTMVQYRKTLSVLLRGHVGYDPTSKPVAMSAFYSMMVKLTRARNWSAIPFDDTFMCEMVRVIDIRVGADLQFFTGGVHSQSVAARINEAAQEDRIDCDFTDEGEDWTLGRTKADRLATGISRFKKHRQGCKCIGKTKEATLTDACAAGEDGKLRGETRCAPCAKVALFKVQGGDWKQGPSYRKLKKGRKFSFEYRAAGIASEDIPLASADDFEMSAQTDDEWQRQLKLVVDEMNKVLPPGRKKYLRNRVHWHGWRHGCALLCRYVVPKMTHLEIALHCRMSLQVLMWYLSHNQGARDPSNRTDEFVGVQTYSVTNVARWCAERSELLQLEQVRSAFQVMQLDFRSFVTVELTDLQHFMRAAGSSVIPAGLYLMLTRAHKEFTALHAAASSGGATVAAREQVDESAAMRAEFARHGLNYDEFASASTTA